MYNDLQANVKDTRIETFACSCSPEPMNCPTLTAAAIEKPEDPCEIGHEN